LGRLIAPSAAAKTGVAAIARTKAARTRKRAERYTETPVTSWDDATDAVVAAK
jgi:hypothetical protein